MRFVFYTHSLVSDWNHGNAHFLRGVMRELVWRGHRAIALEPRDGWSRANLLAEQGPAAIERFRRDFPELVSIGYGPDFDHEGMLEAADAVIVHEWTEPEIVARLGRMRRNGAGFTLLFHDTHHRAVSDTRAISGLGLRDYDGVLAFGESLSQLYRERGWHDRVYTWHEAADTTLFHPRPEIERRRNLVWIGNWGDGERASELEEFLLEPVRQLRIRGTVHGVRYPAEALAALREAGLDYAGWTANADVPRLFAGHRLTVHVPRRPYVEALPGIPTIRVFEALAAGIPLISAPWEDSEGLFRPGHDFLFARNGKQMAELMALVLHDTGFAQALSRAGHETILARHTCRHRVDALFDILRALRPNGYAIPELEAAE